ncbi:hypothetical protein L798_15673 [Zootermopsis nevadensis]|uniref:Uncharacterized protein n=1 Tax=Zootermopsis nevadensis TaxID=136037 RepID=A0A067QLK0_ZOONE|nr:hypothetical protein L798_15673 [Zootermopsis nevadensis]
MLLLPVSFLPSSVLFHLILFPLCNYLTLATLRSRSKRVNRLIDWPAVDQYHPRRTLSLCIIKLRIRKKHSNIYLVNCLNIQAVLKKTVKEHRIYCPCRDSNEIHEVNRLQEIALHLGLTLVREEQSKTAEDKG